MTYAAGLMNGRARFERRSTAADDGYGNERQTWGTICTLAAGFLPERGREDVDAGRLQSTLRGVVTVHRSSMSRSVQAEDRIVFIAGPFNGQTFNIRSVMPRPDAATIEFSVEAGVAI